jgi:PEP-CTERM motif
VVTSGLRITGLTEIRSNDFFLSLEGSLLTSGTISRSGPYFRPDPFSFSYTGDHVNAGDTLTLVVQHTPGEDSGAGSLDGVNLTITETTATSQTPEPGSLLLLATGLISTLGLLRRKLLA